MTSLEAGLIRKAVLLDLTHLTESAEQASAGLKKETPYVRWVRLSRLRNRGLIHAYAAADLEDIGACVRREVPKLRRQLDRLSYPDE
ncbi:MAG: DUF86 domain-containing protein [Thermoplasmata archaeon]|nr:DUF86 domain-containing protein [Thermoplasmata archaeon]MCI4340763.1 DUF86 domain-containing protein [Thermoplasmata archaeon]